MKKLIFFILSLFLISSFSFIQAQTLPEETNSQQDELERIKKELEEKRGKIEELNKKQKDIFAKLKDFEDEIELVSELLRRMDKKISQLTLDLKIEQKKIGGAQKDLEQRKVLLASRLKEIYKHGRINPAYFYLQASSAWEILKNYRFLSLVVEQDKKLAQKIYADKTLMEKNEQKISSDLSQLDGLKKEKAKESKTLGKKKKNYENLLKKASQEKKYYNLAISDLEKSKKKIEDLLKSYEKKEKVEETPKGIFETLKGRLTWPVEGKISLYYGEQKDPKFKTKIFNPGIDIKTQPERKVKACASGKVLYSSWLRGYGNFVILAHGDGYYTLYARLSEVLVNEGEEVESLRTIGKTGIDDLHFEIRKGKKELDPLEWLK
jgi:septal ring factor EnvC (AmiA/AmiB activator)